MGSSGRAADASPRPVARPWRVLPLVPGRRRLDLEDERHVVARADDGRERKAGSVTYRRWTSSIRRRVVSATIVARPRIDAPQTWARRGRGAGCVSRIPHLPLRVANTIAPSCSASHTAAARRRGSSVEDADEPRREELANERVAQDVGATWRSSLVRLGRVLVLGEPALHGPPARRRRRAGRRRRPGPAPHRVPR